MSTNNNASNITMGTLSDDRLSTNIVTKTYHNANKQKDASQLINGTLNDLRLSTNVVLKSYLNSKLLPIEMYLDHKFIIENFSVKFFISAYFWNGLALTENLPPTINIQIYQEMVYQWLILLLLILMHNINIILI